MKFRAPSGRRAIVLPIGAGELSALGTLSKRLPKMPNPTKPQLNDNSQRALATARLSAKTGIQPTEFLGGMPANDAFGQRLLCGRRAHRSSAGNEIRVRAL